MVVRSIDRSETHNFHFLPSDKTIINSGGCNGVDSMCATKCKPGECGLASVNLCFSTPVLKNQKTENRDSELGSNNEIMCSGYYRLDSEGNTLLLHDSGANAPDPAITHSFQDSRPGMEPVTSVFTNELVKNVSCGPESALSEAKYQSGSHFNSGERVSYHIMKNVSDTDFVTDYRELQSVRTPVESASDPVAFSMPVYDGLKTEGTNHELTLSVKEVNMCSDNVNLMTVFPRDTCSKVVITKDSFSLTLPESRISSSHIVFSEDECSSSTNIKNRVTITASELEVNKSGPVFSKAVCSTAELTSPKSVWFTVIQLASPRPEVPTPSGPASVPAGGSGEPSQPHAMSA